MLDIDELKFDEKGLIPAVIVDAFSKKVLTQTLSILTLLTVILKNLTASMNPNKNVKLSVRNSSVSLKKKQENLKVLNSLPKAPFIQTFWKVTALKLTTTLVACQTI